MNKNELKQVIADCCNDITFFYNGKKSGVTSEVENYVPTFQAWHGNSVKSYADVEEVMKDQFYGGKSLSDLADVVKISVI